jgi:hypothetical protein
MTHQDEISALVNRLVAVLDESEINDASALAALKITEILFLNRQNVQTLQTLEEKFGLRLTS